MVARLSRQADRPRQAVDAPLERIRKAARPAHAALDVKAAHAQDARAAVGLEIGPADEPAPEEEGQHVVTERALVLALVDLDHVAESEQPLGERPVPEE